MRLQKIGGCDDGTCPTVYATERGTLVVQGTTVIDPEVLASVQLPAHEALVEVPAELLLDLKVEP
jgi:hypothetical protein